MEVDCKTFIQLECSWVSCNVYTVGAHLSITWRLYSWRNTHLENSQMWSQFVLFWQSYG